MKKALTLLFFLTLFFLVGCGNDPFSPEQRKIIENTNGAIEEMKDNQNGIMTELLTLQQSNDIQARDIDNIQTGLVNQDKSNSGIQILQGDGALIMVFALCTISMLLIYHYKKKSDKSQKSAEIMAQQISKRNDQYLNEDILLAALNTDVESEVYNLIKKN